MLVRDVLAIVNLSLIQLSAEPESKFQTLI